MKRSSNNGAILVGSRQSRLAVLQTQLVMDQISVCCPELLLQMVTMKTTGDLILDRSLDKIGGKGLFVKELDRALLERRTDLSVHSLKDMPMEVPGELPIIAYSKREDARDVLVLPKGRSEWDKSKPVGCSCLRRQLQFQLLYPEAVFKPIRGNVVSRLEKLDSGAYGALILAAAGLKRLGLEARISRFFTPEEILPSAGQGILAVQGRADQSYPFAARINCRESEYAAHSERAFVRRLNGGCSSPVAAYAVIDKDLLHLTGMYYHEPDQILERGMISGAVIQAERLGIRLADQLKGRFEKGGYN